MKKAMRRPFMVLLMVLGAWLMGLSNLSAQSSFDQLLGQNYNWKSEVEAKSVLENTLIQLGDQLGSLNPGTQAYYTMLNRISYHKLTYQKLEDGESVSKGVEFAVANVGLSDTTPSGSTSNSLPSGELTSLFLESVALLTN